MIPARADERTSPVLVTGTLQGPDGSAIRGPIHVTAWPTGVPLHPGDRVAPRVVATGRTDGLGAFELATSRTPETPAGDEWHFSR